jgi:SAM-dependent methyltransferase
MHMSSSMKVEAFLQIHVGQVTGGEQRTVLDIGSASYGTGKVRSESYRSLAEAAGLAYTGLDMQPGPNVDIVSKHPLLYDELERESFDLIVSGQTFEHNPYFWVTFCEVARILKQGGHTMIVAPSAGKVHRFPYDCWRFYPDSWAVLCALSGLELMEIIFEPSQNLDLVRGAKWGDSAVVAAKPRFATATEAESFYARLETLTLPYRDVRTDIEVRKINHGPVFDTYSRLVMAHVSIKTHKKAALTSRAAAEPEAVPKKGTSPDHKKLFPQLPYRPNRPA